jgi:hypothetical protein
VIAGVLLSFYFSFDDVIISFKPGLKGGVAAIVVITLAVSLIGILSAAALLMRGRNRSGTLGGLLD